MAEARNNNPPQQPQQSQQPQPPPQQSQPQPQHAYQPNQPNPQAREGARPIEPYRRSNEMAGPGWGMSSPFSFMRRFMGDMDRLFDDFGLGGLGPSLLTPQIGEGMPRGLWAPKVDVFERGGQLVVHADLPGLRQEDVKVNVEPGILTISGERRHSHEHEKGGVYQCERSYGTFQRDIALPEGVDPETVKASFDNGVLEVTMPMPKPQAQRGKQIPIGPKQSGGGVKH